ncbi:hypothetical protein EDC01DRAFT_275881 [Geopyxis carbonaria]|nr:hypothetical protein EDC01DRAFT_275881 [Geopyxis carbonaria]
MPFTMPFASPSFKKSTSVDLRVDIPPQMANGMSAYNGNNGAHSPTPFIKNEPQDDSNRFTQHHGGFNSQSDAYSMSAGSQFHGFHTEDSIDPSALSMPIQQNGGFMGGFSSLQGNQGGLSYMGGGGGVDDEDLLATLDERPDGHYNVDHHQHENYGNPQDMSTLNNLFPDMDGESKGNGIPVDHVFSHTPENAPAESPYIRSFPTQQYRQLQNYNGNTIETPSSYNASPIIGSDSTQGTHFDQYMSTGKRKVRPGMERTGSQRSPVGMSPHTPKTPGLGALSLGTESSSLPGQPIQNSHLGHRHHKSLSNQWDGTPGSYMESPLSSPGQGPGAHAGISEVFKGKHASLPAKVDNGMGGGPAFQTQEAKRRRRRESHNMVERRRRDNINERIQELSHLVPQHRLEDEKVRKQLINNGSLSPTVGGASGSPPRATSMLAGGIGRRASGVPTTAGLTGEEKDKGPNKGDILNGAVGWTRDLMWAMHKKLEQEQELRELVARLGGTYPFEQSEDEKRMASELEAAVGKNGVHTFRYSRAPGTSLRVPGYTDFAGQPIGESGSDRVSPATSTGKPAQNGGSSRGTPQHQQTFWNQGEDITFKEEDEFNGMDMS